MLRLLSSFAMLPVLIELVSPVTSRQPPRLVISDMSSDSKLKYSFGHPSTRVPACRPFESLGTMVSFSNPLNSTRRFIDTGEEPSTNRTSTSLVTQLASLLFGGPRELALSRSSMAVRYHPQASPSTRRSYDKLAIVARAQMVSPIVPGKRMFPNLPVPSTPCRLISVLVVLRILRSPALESHVHRKDLYRRTETLSYENPRRPDP